MVAVGIFGERRSLAAAESNRITFGQNVRSWSLENKVKTLKNPGRGSELINYIPGSQCAEG